MCVKNLVTLADYIMYNWNVYMMLSYLYVVGFISKNIQQTYTLLRHTVLCIRIIQCKAYSLES